MRAGWPQMGNPVEGFYASAFPSDVVTAGASQFAGLLGDAGPQMAARRHALPR